jgi:hypothetical protein
MTRAPMLVLTANRTLTATRQISASQTVLAIATKESLLPNPLKKQPHLRHQRPPAGWPGARPGSGSASE